ncbi:Pyrimidine 5'-nucleotidase, eukaryotic [Dillenia turbinata]|uniref:5'-nucleotidase n=1 Tax=Dillenia turbinata TaxID=194707 RepID=A0AAN8ZDB3_9MAGN
MDSVHVSEMVVDDPSSLEIKKTAIRSAGPHKLQTFHGCIEEFSVWDAGFKGYTDFCSLVPTIIDAAITYVMALLANIKSLRYLLMCFFNLCTSCTVIADFDATLTKYLINGLRGQSSYGLLHQGNPEYDTKRQELYEYYHPLEFSTSIPIQEKTKLMKEWWGKTHALLIEGGLTYDAIKKSVADATIAFRDGVAELLEFLEEREVPVLIFSAGIADIIEEVLRQKLHRSFKNVKIVSNRMVFDDKGCLISFKGKLIHVLNKNEHAIDMAAPVHERLDDSDEPIDDCSSMKTRINVLLLGDHIGDLGMSDGLNYENQISVGFLNHNVDESLNSYRKAFDVVYLNDAPMWGVVKLVSQLCPPTGSSQSCFE